MGTEGDSPPSEAGWLPGQIPSRPKSRLREKAAQILLVCLRNSGIFLLKICPSYA